MTPNTTEALKEEREALLAEAGELILASAFMHYLAPLTEAEQAAFETYVAEHGSEEGFIDTLCAQYPDFAPILEAEIAAMLSTESRDVS